MEPKSRTENTATVIREVYEPGNSTRYEVTLVYPAATPEALCILTNWPRRPTLVFHPGDPPVADYIAEKMHLGHADAGVIRDILRCTRRPGESGSS